jgi:hypothetical protein
VSNLRCEIRFSFRLRLEGTDNVQMGERGVSCDGGGTWFLRLEKLRVVNWKHSRVQVRAQLIVRFSFVLFRRVAFSSILSVRKYHVRNTYSIVAISQGYEETRDREIHGQV